MRGGQHYCVAGASLFLACFVAYIYKMPTCSSALPNRTCRALSEGALFTAADAWLLTAVSIGTALLATRLWGIPVVRGCLAPAQMCRGLWRLGFELSRFCSREP